jgi:hypothetical protein
MALSRSPGTRLRMGIAVLTAAKAINTKPVRARLLAFIRAQGDFATAQTKVEKAEAALSAAEASVVECDQQQDEAVEVLARALINEGQSRTKPFAGCGGPTPAAIMHLSMAQEAHAIQTLVAALKRSPGLSKATQHAMTGAERAAQAVEKALEPIVALQAAVNAARQARDALIPTWNNALAALKRGTQAAVDEGEPHLHAALFPPPAHKGHRNGKRTPNTPPSSAPPAPTTASVTSA